MSHDFCLACGVLLPIYSKICHVCSFDNGFDEYQDIPLDGESLMDSMDDLVPDHYLEC